MEGSGRDGNGGGESAVGSEGVHVPPGWDNDDGELFGILWAVSMGYEEGRQKHGEDSKEVVMVLTDSWSMVQAVEGSWKMGGAAEGAARARAMMIEESTLACTPYFPYIDIVHRRSTSPSELQLRRRQSNPQVIFSTSSTASFQNRKPVDNLL